MATTAGGTYYAASSELVSDWPATSLNLANQLESRFANKANISDVGKIKQVVSTTKTDTFSTTSTSWTGVTGLSAAITPTSTSSRVLVIVTLGYGHAYATTQMGIQIQRGGVSIFQGDAAGSRNRAAGIAYQYGNDNYPATVTIHCVDSPASTSSLTYQAFVRTEAGTSYINRSANDPDNSSYGYRTASSITVIEIGS